MVGPRNDAGSADTVPADAPLFAPLRQLLPLLWPRDRLDLRLRVILALVAMVIAKIITVAVPFAYAQAVDTLKDPTTQAVAVAMGLILAYGIGRIAMQGFQQLRDAIFARVAYHAMRELGGRVFRHLHGMSLRFHLERRTGGLSRVVDRGTKGIDTLLSFAIFSIFPTILELAIVTGVLLWLYDVWFALITLAAIVGYGWFTIAVTQWRTKFRRQMNDADTDANTKAIDSLLNYETVKYFNTEAHESARFDRALTRFTEASVHTQTSLSLLNAGQAAIIAAGLTAVMALAAQRIGAGTMTIGDLVLVNAFLVQLYVPLNLLGTVFREVQQSLIDMQAMFGLLGREHEVKDRPGAAEIKVSGGEVRFEDVHFAYSPDRSILKGVSFTIPAGGTVAVVGPSGAGKSTLSRILYRFYDIGAGRVTIDGQDIRDVTQASLRRAIGMVPQDTVLFNDTIGYNIGYGRIGADAAEIAEAARLAQLAPFIAELPEGYDAQVGERGLKLSGGEKQRVAIARTILKNPPILILDEATSALDTHTEREIQAALDMIAENRTTLVIAHRLSTIVGADEILVLDHGQIVERGSHEALLAREGVYAALWRRQLSEERARETLEECAAEEAAAE